MPDRSTSLDARADEAPTVDDLLVELLERTEDDPNGRTAVVDEICRRWPSRAARFRSAVQTLGDVGFLDQDDLPESIGEFRPIRRLGGGGMGVVLLAEQPSLERTVALKLVRTDALMQQGSRERFRREIEAVARLAHPNVVSVHSIGEHGGTPYLVMDHVEGASLDAIVAAHVGESPESLTGDDFRVAIHAALAAQGIDAPEEASDVFEGSWAETCIRVAREVAHALAHAHARGVLHRDVKPSNVMVGATGRVQLVDFGLAAVADSERLTQSGMQLGSLPYIPPEHLEGLAEPDQRGDVYSLGVTLFELLILQLPFPARGTKKLREDIEVGRFVRPRAANAAISQDLETVLRCACDPDPRRRYPTAGAFAADLTNVLEGHPITARPASLRRRASLWARRHPEKATLAAIVAAAVVLGPMTFGFVQRSHAREVTELNRQLGVSLEEQTRARERADAHYVRAREAIFRVSGQMARSGLEHEPRMQAARLAIADDAIRLFADLVAERSDDLAILRQWAHLHRIRGDIYAELGRPEEALADHELHDDVYVEILTSESSTLQDRFLRGLGRNQRAIVLRELSRLDESLASFEMAREDMRVALAENRDDVVRLTAYVRSSVYYMRALIEAGSMDVADSVGREVSRDAERLVTLSEELDRTQSTFAQYARTMADLVNMQGDFEQMEHWSRTSAQAARRALELAPGSRYVQSYESDALIRLAFALTRQRRFDEAVEALEACEAVAAELERRYPSIYDYHERRVEILSRRSLLEAERGRHAEAIDYAEAAVERHQAYCDRHGTDPVRLRRLIGLRAELSGRIVMCVPLGEARYARAEVHARGALEAIDEADAAGEESPVTRGLALYNLVLALTGQDRVADAREAVDRLDQVTGTQAQHLRLLADAWCELHLAAERTGAVDAEHAERAIETLERAVEAGYRDQVELGSTPALDFLRSNPRFDALMKRVGGSD